MSELNQEANSISPVFDENLNDALIRRYILRKVYTELIDANVSTTLVDNVHNEMLFIEREIKDMLDG